jgi:hypothetical protein
VIAPALKDEPAEPVFALALRGIDDPAATVAEIERLAAL